MNRVRCGRLTQKGAPRAVCEAEQSRKETTMCCDNRAKIDAEEVSRDMIEIGVRVFKDKLGEVSTEDLVKEIFVEMLNISEACSLR